MQNNKHYYENQNQNINDNVVLAYLNLLTQHTEYLKPNKFNHADFLSGRRTTGEIITTPDPFHNVDFPAHKFDRLFKEGKIKRENVQGTMYQC